MLIRNVYTMLITSRQHCRVRIICKGAITRIAVLIGILGTALFSVVLLGITFAATSVIGAIISGLLVGFFALIISGTVCLVKKTVICNA